MQLRSLKGGLAQATALLACSSQLASALPAFPDAGKVYLAGWTLGSSGYSDTPSAMNARLNLSLPAFQLGQRIPLAPYDYVLGTGWDAFTYLIDWTQTNTNYFLTIYADGGISNVTDGDLVALGSQLAGYEAAGRTVYLRFCPEMQGNWNVYGLQPIEYIALWKRMYAIVKDLAPNTTIVWSPNFSYGYPYGVTLDDVPTQADRAALDTNGDGQLTGADDAYSPYYPGAEFVDAAGISIYYKGPNFANLNQPQPDGYMGYMLDGFDPYTGEDFTPFYSTYCALANCIISETGSAYHVDVEGGSSQLEMQQAWWEGSYFNSTFYSTYPNIKMIMMFEHEKDEIQGSSYDLRDYRISNVSTIAEAFVAAASGLPDQFVWATSEAVPGVTGTIPTAIPTYNPVLVSEAPATATVSVGNDTAEVVTWTETFYSSPTPFGMIDSSAAVSIASQAATEIPTPVTQAVLVKSAAQLTQASSAVVTLGFLILGSVFTILR